LRPQYPKIRDNVRLAVHPEIERANLYKKVLLAYDGSVEGRRALREGAKLARFCGAEVFLLAVVEISSGTVTLEGGFAIPVEEQIATYEAILAEGVERLKAIGFSPTARLGMGSAGQEIAGVAEEIGANLVVVGHRPTGPLARWWFGSVGAYLIKHLRCSVLVAQTEISDDQFAQLLTVPAEQA
jgi:nucleotide-binding universal stress UspA family protein